MGKILTLRESDIHKIVKDVLTELRHTVSERNTSFKATLNIEKIFNLKEIPEEELKKAYNDFYLVGSVSTFGGPFEVREGEIISEAATYTMSVEDTKRTIQQKFNLRDWQIHSQKGANKVELILLIPGTERNIDALKKSMAACGWSYAAYGEAKINGVTWAGLSFDPVFQYDASSEIRQYPNLYHWTPEYHYNTIRKEGLKPRNENSMFHYPNRLHLIKGNTPITAIIDIGKQLFNSNKNPENNGDYVLFAIPVNKIPTETEIYLDPRFEYGCYTKNSISPDILKVIYRYDFKTDEILPIPH